MTLALGSYSLVVVAFRTGQTERGKGTNQQSNPSIVLEIQSDPRCLMLPRSRVIWKARQCLYRPVNIVQSMFISSQHESRGMRETKVPVWPHSLLVTPRQTHGVWEARQGVHTPPNPPLRMRETRCQSGVHACACVFCHRRAR